MPHICQVRISSDTTCSAKRIHYIMRRIKTDPIHLHSLDNLDIAANKLDDSSISGVPCFKISAHAAQGKSHRNIATTNPPRPVTLTGDNEFQKQRTRWASASNGTLMRFRPLQDNTCTVRTRDNTADESYRECSCARGLIRAGVFTGAQVEVGGVGHRLIDRYPCTRGTA